MMASTHHKLTPRALATRRGLRAAILVATLATSAAGATPSSSSSPTRPEPTPTAQMPAHVRQLAADLALANITAPVSRATLSPRAQLPCSYTYQFVSETQNALLKKADCATLQVSAIDAQHVRLDLERLESSLDNGAPDAPFYDDTEFRPGTLSATGATRSRLLVSSTGITEEPTAWPVMFPNRVSSRACPGLAFLPTTSSALPGTLDWLSTFVRPGYAKERPPEQIGSGRFRVVGRATAAGLPIVLVDAELQLEGEYRFPSGPARGAYAIEESTGWPLAARVLRNDAGDASRAVFTLRKTGNCGPVTQESWKRPALAPIMTLARRFVFYWGQLRPNEALSLFDSASLGPGGTAEASRSLLRYAGKAKATSHPAGGDLRLQALQGEYIVEQSGFKEFTSARITIRGDKIHKVIVYDTEKHSVVFRLGR